MTRICLLALVAATLPAQVADKANANYRTREAREGMARTLGDPQRPARLRTNEILRILGVTPGATVAELGTGTGAMLAALSQAAGPQGKVLAEDIYPDFLEKARALAKTEGLNNVSFVLGGEKSAGLPAGSCDWIVTVDAYHHFDYPAEMLASVRAALRTGGRFAIVDYYRRENAMDSPGQALQHIRLDRDDVIKEVAAQGFRLVKTEDNVTGKQYVAVFEPR